MISGSTTDAGDGPAPTPDGLAPDAAPNTAPDGGIAKVLRLDSCEDFKVDGSQLSNAVIEPWGALGPAPLLTQVLVAHGADMALFSDPVQASWDDISRARTSGVGVTTLEPIVLTTGAPPGVGLEQDNDWTWWAEGEVFINAGAQQWALRADAYAFLDLAAPGATRFERVITAQNDVAQPPVAWQANVTGWYRIRIAWANSAGNSRLELLHRPPGGPRLDPVDRDRLRAPADDLNGLVARGFEDAHWLDGRGVGLSRDRELDIALNGALPAELGLRDDRTFSVRWSGQVRINVAGEYRFAIDSDDGHRIRIDGTPLSDDLNGGPQVSLPITLDTGWHDLVVELSNVAGAASIRLGVESGPELAGQAIPRERLRPATGRRERVTAGSDPRAHDLPAGGEAAAAMALAAPIGARVTGIDVGVTVDHPRWQDLELVVQAPDGSTAQVIAASGIPRSGVFTERRASARLNGSPASGTWTVIVRDGGSGAAGTLRSAAITVHYHGGEPATALSGAYESRIYDLGAVFALDRVSWSARALVGTEARVFMRTCAEAKQCATEPWSPPLVPDQAPAVPVRRHMQLRLEVRTAGDLVPALDWVQVDYRVTE